MQNYISLKNVDLVTETWARKALSLAIKRAKEDLDVRTALEIYNCRPTGLDSMVHAHD